MDQRNCEHLDSQLGFQGDCFKHHFAGSAAAIWQDLHTRFQQKNASRVYQLKKDLVTLSQGNLTVSQYFTRLKSIWEELLVFRPTFVCNCGGARDFLEHVDREYMLAFLMGLNDSYQQIRGQILLMEPLPSISKVFSLISQEERQCSIGSGSTGSETQLAFTVKGANKGGSDAKPRSGKKDRPTCSHCGLLGHTKDKCYKIHGYPPHYEKAVSAQAHQIDAGSIAESPSLQLLPA